MTADQITIAVKKPANDRIEIVVINSSDPGGELEREIAFEVARLITENKKQHR
jgi:hypothetical protein